MHANVDELLHLQQISGFLGSYYLALCLMNAIAAYYVWIRSHRSGLALAWLILAAGYLVMAPIAFSGNPELMRRWISVPQGLRDFIDTRLANAVVYGIGTLGGLIVMFVLRRFLVRPAVAWVLLNVAVLFMGLSMTDMDFAKIVTKPDNVPIVAMVFLLGYFTWLGAYQAVQNDERIARGLKPREKEGDEKILVWPDLVYTEMICMVALTALLIFWAIGLKAPLEDPASSVRTPNPSKAPWYFLGLQEMLVYFDPWMAGVVLPSMVIFGLMAVPFMDFNKKGNGYYTINERKFAYLMFQFGFLELWVTLIILGTFLRGPNWNFFGPYEPWDPHKVVPLNNVDLSQYFWNWLEMPLPRPPDGAAFLPKLGWILVRESPGIVLTFGYLLIMPVALATTVFRKFYARMGLIRYMLMSNLLLIMLMLPIKMVLRWSFNLKYIISIPEYFLNL